MRRLLLAGVAFLAFVTPGHARSLSYICDGTISYYPLSAYTAITGQYQSRSEPNPQNWTRLRHSRLRLSAAQTEPLPISPGANS